MESARRRQEILVRDLEFEILNSPLGRKLLYAENTGVGVGGHFEAEVGVGVGVRDVSCAGVRVGLGGNFHV